MSEYRYILSLYQKSKNYERNVVFVSLALLIAAGIFVSLDLVRVAPFLIFAVTMSIALIYAVRTRVKSKNYEKLKKYLEKNDPEIMQNERLVFFIAYQLDSYFTQESAELIDDLLDDDKQNDEKAQQKLTEIIAEIKDYYEYVSVDNTLDENIEISLQWYRDSKENRKRDFV